MIFTVLLSTTDSYAVNISVTTDRAPAVLNESFVMTFESDDSVDDDPDFRPLNRDFQVLSSGTSSNMSIINGKISTTKSWTLNVMARRTGTLGIPPISFGSDMSIPSTISVVKAAPGSASRSNREIFLEVELSTDKAYVQSEVIYTVRLFRSVATANASLSDPPEITGATTAVVEKLGDDKSYDTRRAGKLFGVVERKYGIYPQASGSLTIEPIIFQGQITRGSSFFRSPFGRQPRTVVVRSKTLSLDVQPKPDAFKGIHWLPAREINLTEEWSEYPLEFTLNEPITRTLTLTVKGQTSSQLPEFPQWQTSAFKQYPDQPVLEDDRNSKGITGKRVEKIAMIPHRTGTYTLPEISIPWWNTATHKMGYATIPERQIKVVLPVSAQIDRLLDISPPPIGDLDLADISIDPYDPQTDAMVGQTINDSLEQMPSRIWQWLSLALFIIWIITLVMWRRAKRTNVQMIDDNDSKASARTVIKEFKQSCLKNNPASAKEKLLVWGKLSWPQRPPASIGEIANRCGEVLASEIRLLNNVLYSRTSINWQGKELWQVFEQGLKEMESKTELNKGKLEPLFKI